MADECTPTRTPGPAHVPASPASPMNPASLLSSLTARVHLLEQQAVEREAAHAREVSLLQGEVRALEEQCLQLFSHSVSVQGCCPVEGERDAELRDVRHERVRAMEEKIRREQAAFQQEVRRLDSDMSEWEARLAAREESIAAREAQIHDARAAAVRDRDQAAQARARAAKHENSCNRLASAMEGAKRALDRPRIPATAAEARLSLGDGAGPGLQEAQADIADIEDRIAALYARKVAAVATQKHLLLQRRRSTDQSA